MCYTVHGVAKCWTQLSNLHFTSVQFTDDPSILLAWSVRKLYFMGGKLGLREVQDLTQSLTVHEGWSCHLYQLCLSLKPDS